MKTILFLFCVSCFALNAQIPPGAVSATANTVYYAGGQCAFYDAAGRELLTVDAAEAVWSCSPAKAAWALVTPRNGGYYEFPNYTANPSRVSTHEMLRPFWQGDTITKEAVVLTGIGSESRLLYRPRKIISVTNYNGTRLFGEGVDYTMSGNVITQKSAGPSQTYVAKQGQRGNGTPNGLINVAATSWTYVTYVRERDGWDPSAAWSAKGALLPNTLRKLQQGKPLTVQALGMSLTAGLNVSGFAGDAKNFPPTDPYMRSYVDLFCDHLQNQFKTDVTLHNSSCGGKTIAWADRYCRQLVSPNNPDLVIIDMGMNDIWGQTSGSAFRASLESTIQKIKSDCPDAEFILISNMLPDVNSPGAPKDGEAWIYEFLRQMNALEGPAVAVFDMTTTSKALYDRKGASCFTSNSLHPNDYMARWYAQGLVHLVTGMPTSVDGDDHTSASTELNVFPNPVSDGSVCIDAAPLSLQADTPLTAQIYSVSGQLVRHVTAVMVNSQVHISTQGLAQGAYHVVVQSDDRSGTAGFVVMP
ncbi:MAG: T9SS type A sorting domain-containing protein [Candidatus Kapabacteria bacterium]|nr:T9SS type A sorting domain-containing protein [Candidatus Kapabacteria bacterium]